MAINVSHPKRAAEFLLVLILNLGVCSALILAAASSVAQIKASPAVLIASIHARDGEYSLRSSDGRAAVRGAEIAAKVDGQWLHAKEYDAPKIIGERSVGELGATHGWRVTYRHGKNFPELIYRLRVYEEKPFADVQVTVRNTTSHAIGVQAIRAMEMDAPNAIDLGGPEAEERLLSDSFSEARPAMKVHEFTDAPDHQYRGIEVQMIYNRESKESWFAGALTTDKFLTILRLRTTGDGAAEKSASYEVVSTGTTELAKENSLKNAVAADQMELSVTLRPGEEISSERVLMGLDADYHRQLETYGAVIRQLHHARVAAKPPMGWWSWTAYYSSVREDEALVNAEWLAKNLKDAGYNYFFVDEGYSIARGDYLTASPERFPDGMEYVVKKARALGLKTGIWTAPFEVASNAWVYKNHPEWLVHNADGKPILLGRPTVDDTYVLDTTHPGAQAYLRKTYSTMAKVWGVNIIKMDFMEDTSIEGVRYRSGTTALEAQRIGLKIIREAVGENVLLDKDESVMLNPVGIVDIGRTSHDTSHKFETVRGASWGIAERYYMNRNYFVTDPDAFMATPSSVKGTLTLDEAKCSIAMAMVSGGMMEIGDALPQLSEEPERLALIKNSELIEIARLGKTSIPLDLMDYKPEDGQPSIFYLKENSQQSILTIFNWTDGKRTKEIRLDELGVKGDREYKITSVWDGKVVQQCSHCELYLLQLPHSVEILKITAMTGAVEIDKNMAH